MKISAPPRTSNREFNLRKQGLVFDAVFDGRFDTLLHFDSDAQNLESTHDKDWLQRIRTGRAVNGFSDTDYRKVLHAEESCAALLAACYAALNRDRDGDGKAVAFAPVSGFHHSGYDHAAGYCTFNGLVWAAQAVRSAGLANKVLILDADGHFGDGTQELIEHHKLDWLTSWWIAGQRPAVWDEWRTALKTRLKSPSVSLVIYQAGADSHEDDPYGAGTVTTHEWIERDRFIFKLCRDASVPIVWNLAGGYNGGKTIDLHTSTFETAVDVFYPGELTSRKSIPRGLEVLGRNPRADGPAGL